MLQIILSGCGGAMGRTIAERVALRTDSKILFGIDPHVDSQTAQGFSFPVYKTPEDAPAPNQEDPTVVVNFSHPSSVPSLTAYAVRHSLPLVEATTGLEDSDIQRLRDASQTIPVFFSANMSLGVNLLVELARKATQVLGSDFDIEIIEKHHNKKIDAPSGTALMIADAIAEEIDPTPPYVYQRESRREPRHPGEIGIHAVRGGTIVGDHEVLFAGEDEIITLSHHAASKKLFATGAINAALFLQGKPATLYSMKDLIDSV